MGKTARIAAVLSAMVALVGSATPYQSKGFRGGYTDRRLGDGRYFIEVGVNSFTSRGTALEYFHRRADELCPTGYDVFDRDADTAYVTDGKGNAYAKPNVSGVIECRRSPAPQVVAATTAPVAVPGKYHACSHLQGGEGGACFASIELCNDARLEVAKNGVGTTDCYVATSVYCFQGQVKFCYPTRSICEREQANAAHAGGGPLGPSACYVD